MLGETVVRGAKVEEGENADAAVNAMAKMVAVNFILN